MDMKGSLMRKKGRRAFNRQISPLVGVAGIVMIVFGSVWLITAKAMGASHTWFCFGTLFIALGVAAILMVLFRQ